ncbi:ankyrin repeat-containing domain protein [Globomyces pollinis-pini]|nr:ankyrin repeat-containing domain protein [Globomyces pollinis-pini]
MNTEEFNNELILNCRYGELEELKSALESVTEQRKVILATVNGHSCLFMASANGHNDVLKYLFKYILPTDINVQNAEGSTPLHWAALNGHLETVKLLLDFGANATIRNQVGISPATLAEQNNHLECVKVLLESYDPEDDDDDDVQPDASGDIVVSNLDPEYAQR